MNCYHHPDHAAVGICKSCNKGLCSECAVDIGNGLACKNLCEEEVKAINEVVERSKSAYQKTGKAYKQVALVFSLLGAIFLLLGLLSLVFTEDSRSALFTIPFGVIFLIAAFFNVRSGRQISEIDR